MSRFTDLFMPKEEPVQKKDIVVEKTFTNETHSSVEEKPVETVKQKTNSYGNFKKK